MILKQAEYAEYKKIHNAVMRKNIPFCTPTQIIEDYVTARLYAVIEGDKVLATVSIVPDTEHGYTAIKRLCILNKKNEGKGIAKFTIHSILRYLRGKVGVTPWEDNTAMRRVLESEGFHLEYKFNGHWCYYVKEM